MILINFKEIDSAGRIVISKDIRKHLNIEPGDILRIEAVDDSIVIKKEGNKCIFCNSSEDIIKEYNGKFICKSCYEKISSRST